MTCLQKDDSPQCSPVIWFIMELLGRWLSLPRFFFFFSQHLHKVFLLLFWSWFAHSARKHFPSGAQTPSSLRVVWWPCAPMLFVFSCDCLNKCPRYLQIHGSCTQEWAEPLKVHSCFPDGLCWFLLIFPGCLALRPLCLNVCFKINPQLIF